MQNWQRHLTYYPDRPVKTSKRTLELLVFITVALAIVILIKLQGLNIEHAEATTNLETVRRGADPCTLESVVCPNEPKIIYAKVTKYSAKETCDPKNCINAAGHTPQKGISAACPRTFELGHRVVIKGTTYTCDDRTARNYDGRFDLFSGYTDQDHQEALAWGVQVLPVTIY